MSISENAPLRRNGEVRLIKTLDELEKRIASDTDMGGWWRIADDIYHSSSPVSRSSLIKYRLSPANFKIRETDNRNLIVGRAFHDIFSDKNWDKSWFCAPQVDRRTKSGKKDWDEFTEDKDPSRVLTQDEYEMIKRMYDNVTTDKEISNLLDNNIEHELTCFSHEDNVWTKARLDGWRPDDRTIIEIKTTIDKSVDNFSRTFFNMFYDVQAAFYWDRIERGVGVTPERIIFLGFEKNPPYKVYKLDLTDEVITLGRARYKPWLEQHKICTFENSWPANDSIQSLEVPPYLLSKHDCY